MFMEGHFVSIVGESVGTEASCYDCCGDCICTVHVVRSLNS